MKTLIIPLCLLASSAAAVADEFVSVLTQTQLDTGIVSYATIDSESGSFLVDPIPEAGSYFELWVVNQTTGEEFLIDMQYVAPNFGSSTIAVETGDPSTKPRTRIDQDIQLTIDVQGLNNYALTHADLGLEEGTADSQTAVVDASTYGDGTTVYVSSTKDLSNVVLLLDNGDGTTTEEKIEDLTGHAGIFSGSVLPVKGMIIQAVSPS